MSARDAVITAIARTPIGRFEGGLASLRAVDLGAAAMRAAIARSRLPSSALDEVYVGHVLGGGAGQAPARQAARLASIPHEVPCTAINKVCGSGLKAAMIARAQIAAGDADAVLAAGIESMTNAPYLLPRARAGLRMGHGAIVDGMIHDGLWDPFEQVHMGTFGDRYAAAHGVSREAQDAYARESYARALAAQRSGAFTGEIAPVTVADRRGATTTIDADEEPPRFAPDRMAALPPAFGAGGTVTAASASKVSDGAAAVVIASRAAAARAEAPILATIVADATHGGAAGDFPIAPAHAIRKAAAKAGLPLSAIDLFEISEAFAVVPLVVMRELDVPHARVNVHGGAIALGHPIGASGARLLVTLVSALARHGARVGCATLCLGGGEAVAMIVRRG